MIRTIICNSMFLLINDKKYQCSIGRNGLTHTKQEGDLATPIGQFQLRGCYYRADRIMPPPETALPLQALAPNDGWCDAPTHMLYNKPVKLPFDASHERLWRDDHAYDLIVPLSYNDNPTLAGKGSAIFWHIAQPDWRSTEGCVAIARDAMLEILPFCDENTVMMIG